MFSPHVYKKKKLLTWKKVLPDPSFVVFWHSLARQYSLPIHWAQQDNSDTLASTNSIIRIGIDPENPDFPASVWINNVCPHLHKYYYSNYLLFYCCNYSLAARSGLLA